MDDDGDDHNAARAFDNYWLFLKFGGFRSIEYQIDTIIELTPFCLLEPAALGYVTYFVETHYGMRLTRMGTVAEMCTMKLMETVPSLLKVLTKTSDEPLRCSARRA